MLFVVRSPRCRRRRPLSSSGSEFVSRAFGSARRWTRGQVLDENASAPDDAGALRSPGTRLEGGGWGAESRERRRQIRDHLLQLHSGGLGDVALVSVRAVTRVLLLNLVEIVAPLGEGGAQVRIAELFEIYGCAWAVLEIGRMPLVRLRRRGHRVSLFDEPRAEVHLRRKRQSGLPRSLKLCVSLSGLV